jgi:hypothetical protein
MATKRPRSIADVLRDFENNLRSNNCEFKQSPGVVSDLLTRIVGQIGGFEYLPMLTESHIAKITDDKLGGIFRINDTVVFVTQHGAVSHNNNFNTKKLNPIALDCFIKMSEHNFNGKYPGIYTAVSSKFAVIDGKYLSDNHKSKAWRNFSIYMQENLIKTDSKNVDTSYVNSLIRSMNSILSTKDKVEFLEEHIQHLVDPLSSNLFECDPRLLKHLQTQIGNMSVADFESICIDPIHFADGFVMDFRLLTSKPLTHDALMCNVGRMSDLSVSTLGTEQDRQLYISAIESVMKDNILSSPGLEGKLLSAIGGQKFLDIIVNHIEEQLSIERHPEIQSYLRM